MVESVPSLVSAPINLLKKFVQCILGADIQVDLGGFESIVPEDFLQTGSTYTFFHTINSEGVPRFV